ncbi:MAG: helix-turn-helix domain-containing protein [Oscillospiraceae bacterium]|nr:helix-turn-helix domain-containing protein [Oscillospiraceae bacterium]
MQKVCQILGYERKKVYQLIKDDQLKKIPCGRKIKVAKATVIAFVMQSAQK